MNAQQSPALLLLLAAPFFGSGDDPPQAPDGRRGLGVETPLQDLLKLLRTPDEEELEFLAGIRVQGEDVQDRLVRLEDLYRSRSYFDLIEELPEPDLSLLHRSFREHLRDPAAILAPGDPRRTAFARQFADVRFRVRMALLESWQREADELDLGLRVLEAAASGHVELDESQARNLCRRVDLGAAMLRALVLDLEILRELPGWPCATGPDEAAVEQVLGLGAIVDAQERDQRIESAQRRLRARIEDMRRLLFTTRLEEDAAGELSWREEADTRAAALLDEASLVLPREEERPEDLPAHLRGMSKTERRRLAREKAIEGLGFDPLDDQLAYVAAVASRVVHGEAEALSLYDRFLALRGIRSHDDRTYRRRELTDEESEALLFVQEAVQLETPPGADQSGWGGFPSGPR